MKRLLCLALLGAASLSFGQNAVWAGSLDGSEGTFNRPVSLGSLSSVGTSVYYDVQPFYVTLSGVYQFESQQSYDGYILVYSSFDPNSPLTGLLNGDDDYFDSAFPILGSPTPPTDADASRIVAGDGSNYDPASGLTLAAGAQYYAVTTSFANGATGQYVNGIGNGQGAAILGTVPEPASLAVLSIGGLALLKRRRAGR